MPPELPEVEPTGRLNESMSGIWFYHSVAFNQSMGKISRMEDVWNSSHFSNLKFYINDFDLPDRQVIPGIRNRNKRQLLSGKEAAGFPVSNQKT